MPKTLTDIDNVLDYLTIYDQLGSAQHALLHSIVRIFNNQMPRFPESLVIANISLQTKAGIKPGSFHRTRQALIDFRIDQSNNDSWIIRYQENPNQFAGRYWINYDILQLNANATTTDQQPNNSIPTILLQPNNNPTTTSLQSYNSPLSKKAKSDNDLREIRSDQKDKTKKDQTRSDASSSQILSKKAPLDYEKILVGFSYKGISEGELKHVKEYYSEGNVDFIKRFWGIKLVEAIKEWEKVNGYK